MRLAVDQIRIPCTIMRGGTSRGAFFLKEDLPTDPNLRDAVLVAAMGSGSPLQVDGIGGGHPITSKVAIVSASSRPDADVDYLFAQVNVERAQVDTRPNCGNMLAAVGPFALEAGLVPAQTPQTQLRVYNVNTDAIIDVTVETPDGVLVYSGGARIDGVAGTGAPVRLNFKGSEGAVTGALLPTGRLCETIGGVAVSVIDYAVPVMFVRAEEVGLAGDEMPAALTANRGLFDRLEFLRLAAGHRAGMGDVSEMVVPKIAVVSKPRAGGTILSRYFTPHSAHESYPVTGGLCLAVASRLAGTVAAGIEQGAKGGSTVRIEHPVGCLDIELQLSKQGANHSPVASAALIRTARRLFDGHVYVSRRILEDAGVDRTAAIIHRAA